jgi:hypothetical protein
MELLHADEYIACIKAGKKPKIAVAGPFFITNGLVTDTGKYLLVMDGLIYEVKPNFALYVQWGEGTVPLDDAAG